MRAMTTVRTGNPLRFPTDMAKTRQVVLFAAPPAGAPPGKTPSLGPRRDVLKALASFNCAPDGSKDTSLAYGPGFIAQFPLGDPGDDIQQALVGLNEEEIAWPVLSRICKTLGWMMMDPDTGRTFGGA